MRWATLIPPGITFIVYGLITETSVGALYIAAIIPSVIVTAFFIAIIVIARPAQPAGEAAPAAAHGQDVRRCDDLVPTLILIVLVLGSIYAAMPRRPRPRPSAWSAPLVFALIEGGSRFAMLQRLGADDGAQHGAARPHHHGGLSAQLRSDADQRAAGRGRDDLSHLPVPPWGIMLAIIGMYFALGTFMEGFSMIITTVPVVFPIVVGLGYDPIWFGVIVTMLVEIAQISPPDGTVMYVAAGHAPEGRTHHRRLRRRDAVSRRVSWPSVASCCCGHELVLWLPALMR